MKKSLFLSSTLVAAMCLLSVPAHAQFNLKKLTKSVETAATGMASDMAADKVSEKVVTWMDNNNTVSADASAYSKRLQKLTSKLSVEGVTLNFKVYENPEANILACADGSIRVYSGMMDVLTDNELLAVIGNQIGHIVNKDVRDALLDVASEGNASKAGSAQLEKMLSMSGDKFGTVVNELLQVPYTESQNKAADEYAVTFLKSNGKTAKDLATALGKFAAMEANDLKAEAEENVEYSVASKYLKVNSNNSVRASLLN